MNNSDKQVDHFWEMPLPELLGLLQATPAGLTSAEANVRLTLHGPNSLAGESRFATRIGFLYETSQIAVPGDNVDPALLHHPKRWQIGFFYDFLTFGVLLWMFHASTNAALFRTAGSREGGQSVQEPAERAVADWCCCRLRCGGLDGVHANAGIVAGASGKDLVLPAARGALRSGGSERQLTMTNNAC